MAVTLKPSKENQPKAYQRPVWGNALILFCSYGLMFSSAVKFMRPPKAVAYLAVFIPRWRDRNALSSALLFTRGPFLVYTAMHPYIGALMPSTVLAAGWIGTWLSQSQAAKAVNRHVDGGPAQLQSVTREVALGPASRCLQPASIEIP